MKLREFSGDFWMPRPPEELFPFFADASNLQLITPGWLHFEILTPLPIEMKRGAIIDYRLRFRGFPLQWRTRISAWEPPVRFVDEQERGPYKQWIHEHTFVPENGGTRVRDYVRYATPFDWLVHGWLVRPDVERIFAFRKQTLIGRFMAAND